MIPPADLRGYFGNFGSKITECNLKSDIQSGKSKGYAFLSFENPNAIQRVLDSGPHELHGRVLDVKKAKELAEIPEPRYFFIVGSRAPVGTRS